MGNYTARTCAEYIAGLNFLNFSTFSPLPCSLSFKMSDYYAFNGSQTFSSPSGHLHDLTSAVSLRSTVTIAAVAFLSAVIGGTKWLQLIFFAVDRFFGGATHKIALPGPTGLPLVGNLYQVSSLPIAKGTLLNSTRLP